VEACSATQDVVCVHQGSEWAVADVIVFDDWLSDADMQLLGTQMYDSLTDASIDRTAIGDCTGSPDLQACRGKVTGNAVCRKSDACPAGKQFDSTEGGCVPCPLGSYSPDFSTAACIKCPAGRYSDVLGAKKCKSCAWHTYSDVVGAVSQDACTACPENFFTDSPAATSLSDCLSCPIS